MKEDNKKLIERYGGHVESIVTELFMIWKNWILHIMQ